MNLKSIRAAQFSRTWWTWILFTMELNFHCYLTTLLFPTLCRLRMKSDDREIICLMVAMYQAINIVQQYYSIIILILSVRVIWNWITFFNSEVRCGLPENTTQKKSMQNIYRGWSNIFRPWSDRALNFFLFLCVL